LTLSFGQLIPSNNTSAQQQSPTRLCGMSPGRFRFGPFANCQRDWFRHDLIAGVSVAAVAAVVAVKALGLEAAGVAVVGEVPAGLPRLHWPTCEASCQPSASGGEQDFRPLGLPCSVVSLVLQRSRPAR
jgi:hypothetical protein